MGFQSQSGHMIFKKQAVADTYQTDTGTAGVAFRLRSGTLGPNRDLLIADPEIGGTRDIADAYLGAVSWSGDIDIYPRFKHMATILGAVLGGTPGTVTTTGVTTHTITPSDTTALPWYSIEERVGNGFECFRYTDVKFNSLHFEAEANGFWMATLGLIARKQLAGATPSDPTTLLDSSPMGVGTNITVTYNAVTLPAKSFAVDIANNLEDDDFRLGSFFLGDVTEKRRDVTGSVTVRPQDSGLWRQAVYGTSAATGPGGIVTKQQVVVTITAYEDIPGGTPATKYSLTLTFPSAALVPVAVEPSGDDVIEHDFELRMLRPVNATPIVTAVVKTDQATVI